jgi:hypothetical protein
MRTFTVGSGLLLLLGACSPPSTETAAPGGPQVTVIEPGPGLQERAQTALLTAQPGSVIEFAEGTFELAGTLSLDVDNVTVRGRGIDKTVLDFAGQEAGTGGEGMHVTSDGFTIEAMTVQNTKGDGIKVEGTNGATFRNVFVNWVGQPKTENGAYGIYPVQCSNVLVEDSRMPASTSASRRTSSCAATRCGRTWRGSRSRTPSAPTSTTTKRPTTPAVSWCSRCPRCR